MKLSDASAMARKEMDKHGLEHVSLVFNPRLTRAFGRYRYNRLDSSSKRIELSKKLVLLNDEARVMRTVLHEIAHALTEGHGHDAVWKAKCLEIGGDGIARYSVIDTNIPEVKRKIYKLVCQECGSDNFGRYKRRMNNYMHPRCGGKLLSVEIQ